MVRVAIEAEAWPHALHGMAWHGMAWHGMAWHGIALHCCSRSRAGALLRAARHLGLLCFAPQHAAAALAVLLRGVEGRHLDHAAVM